MALASYLTVCISSREYCSNMSSQRRRGDIFKQKSGDGEGSRVTLLECEVDFGAFEGRK